MQLRAVIEFSHARGQPSPIAVQLNTTNAAMLSAGLYCGSTWPHNLGARFMLWTITVILVILWLLGLVSGYTLGGWVHLLLILAVIVLIFNLLSGRRAL
jgi:hypothetical protein